jgi:uncharacterized repeat protein (TIGR03806 family)
MLSRSTRSGTGFGWHRLQSVRFTTGFSLFSLLLALAGCSQQVRPHSKDPFPQKLSSWHLFTGNLAALRPNQGVVPYDLNSPLFSDYASKFRFVWMPQGESALYRADDAFDFPAGTIFSKTFSYPAATGRRLIETRLLVHADAGWTPLPYVWNPGQTEAYLDVAAAGTQVQYGGRTIDYIIPNTNQCKECHDQAKITLPIGPKARNLNKDFDYESGRENQLAHWIRIGYLTGAPPPDRIAKLARWDDPHSGTLTERALAYLEANCAHCHNPNGAANTSGLYFNGGPPDPLRLGVCKVPVSAGLGSGNLRFDLVGGNPAQSILYYRMNSSEPKVMMPELGRTVIHREGLELIGQWIGSMPADCPH